MLFWDSEKQMKTWQWVVCIGLGIGVAVGSQRLSIQPKPAKGGQNPAAKSARYRLNHWETTGITDYLVLDDKEMAIRFSSDSNKAAVEIAQGWTVEDVENPKWPNV